MGVYTKDQGAYRTGAGVELIAIIFSTIKAHQSKMCMVCYGF